MYHRDDTEYVFIFDWRALLRGGHFRYFAFRFQSQQVRFMPVSCICKRILVFLSFFALTAPDASSLRDLPATEQLSTHR